MFTLGGLGGAPATAGTDASNMGGLPTSVEMEDVQIRQWYTEGMQLMKTLVGGGSTSLPLDCVVEQFCRILVVIGARSAVPKCAQYLVDAGPNQSDQLVGLLTAVEQANTSRRNQLLTPVRLKFRARLQYLCYKNLGDAYSRLGHLEHAVECYGTALLVQDDDVLLWLKLADSSLALFSCDGLSPPRKQKALAMTRYALETAWLKTPADIRVQRKLAEFLFVHAEDEDGCLKFTQRLVDLALEEYTIPRWSVSWHCLALHVFLKDADARGPFQMGLYTELSHSFLQLLYEREDDEHDVAGDGDDSADESESQQSTETAVRASSDDRIRRYIGKLRDACISESVLAKDTQASAIVVTDSCSWVDLFEGLSSVLRTVRCNNFEGGASFHSIAFSKAVRFEVRTACVDIDVTDEGHPVHSEREKKRKHEVDEEEWLDRVFCDVCGGGENEQQLLLCDGEHCKGAVHLYCCVPALSATPKGKWFCPVCSTPASAAEAVSGAAANDRASNAEVDSPAQKRRRSSRRRLRDENDGASAMGGGSTRSLKVASAEDRRHEDVRRRILSYPLELKHAWNSIHMLPGFRMYNPARIALPAQTSATALEHTVRGFVQWLAQQTGSSVSEIARTVLPKTPANREEPDTTEAVEPHRGNASAGVEVEEYARLFLQEPCVVAGDVMSLFDTIRMVSHYVWNTYFMGFWNEAGIMKPFCDLCECLFATRDGAAVSTDQEEDSGDHGDDFHDGSPDDESQNRGGFTADLHQPGDSNTFAFSVSVAHPIVRDASVEFRPWLQLIALAEIHWDRALVPYVRSNARVKSRGVDALSHGSIEEVNRADKSLRQSFVANSERAETYLRLFHATSKADRVTGDPSITQLLRLCDVRASHLDAHIQLLNGDSERAFSAYGSCRDILRAVRATDDLEPFCSGAEGDGNSVIVHTAWQCQVLPTEITASRLDHRLLSLEHIGKLRSAMADLRNGNYTEVLRHLLPYFGLTPPAALAGSEPAVPASTLWNWEECAEIEFEQFRAKVTPQAESSTAATPRNDEIDHTLWQILAAATEYLAYSARNSAGAVLEIPYESVIRLQDVLVCMEVLRFPQWTRWGRVLFWIFERSVDASWRTMSFFPTSNAQPRVRPIFVGSTGWSAFLEATLYQLTAYIEYAKLQKLANVVDPMAGRAAGSRSHQLKGSDAQHLVLLVDKLFNSLDVLQLLAYGCLMLLLAGGDGDRWSLSDVVLYADYFFRKLLLDGRYCTQLSNGSLMKSCTTSEIDPFTDFVSVAGGTTQMRRVTKEYASHYHMQCTCRMVMLLNRCITGIVVPRLDRVLFNGNTAGDASQASLSFREWDYLNPLCDVHLCLQHRLDIDRTSEDGDGDGDRKRGTGTDSEYTESDVSTADSATVSCGWLRFLAAGAEEDGNTLAAKGSELWKLLTATYDTLPVFERGSLPELTFARRILFRLLVQTAYLVYGTRISLLDLAMSNDTDAKLLLEHAPAVPLYALCHPLWCARPGLADVVRGSTWLLGDDDVTIDSRMNGAEALSMTRHYVSLGYRALDSMAASSSGVSDASYHSRAASVMSTIIFGTGRMYPRQQSLREELVQEVLPLLFNVSALSVNDWRADAVCFDQALVAECRKIDVLGFIEEALVSYTSAGGASNLNYTAEESECSTLVANADEATALATDIMRRPWTGYGKSSLHVVFMALAFAGRSTAGPCDRSNVVNNWRKLVYSFEENDDVRTGVVDHILQAARRNLPTSYVPTAECLQTLLCEVYSVAGADECDDAGVSRSRLYRVLHYLSLRWYIELIAEIGTEWASKQEQSTEQPLPLSALSSSQLLLMMGALFRRVGYHLAYPLRDSEAVVAEYTRAYAPARVAPLVRVDRASTTELTCTVMYQILANSAPYICMADIHANDASRRSFTANQLEDMHIKVAQLLWKADIPDKNLLPVLDFSAVDPEYQPWVHALVHMLLAIEYCGKESKIEYTVSPAQSLARALSGSADKTAAVPGSAAHSAPFWDNAGQLWYRVIVQRWKRVVRSDVDRLLPRRSSGGVCSPMKAGSMSTVEHTSGLAAVLRTATRHASLSRAVFPSSMPPPKYYYRHMQKALHALLHTPASTEESLASGEDAVDVAGEMCAALRRTASRMVQAGALPAQLATSVFVASSECADTIMGMCWVAKLVNNCFQSVYYVVHVVSSFIFVTSEMLLRETAVSPTQLREIVFEPLQLCQALIQILVDEKKQFCLSMPVQKSFASQREQARQFSKWYYKVTSLYLQLCSFVGDFKTIYSCLLANRYTFLEPLCSRFLFETLRWCYMAAVAAQPADERTNVSHLYSETDETTAPICCRALCTYFRTACRVRRDLTGCVEYSATLGTDGTGLHLNSLCRFASREALLPELRHIYTAELPQVDSLARRTTEVLQLVVRDQAVLCADSLPSIVQRDAAECFGSFQWMKALVDTIVASPVDTSVARDEQADATGPPVQQHSGQ